MTKKELFALPVAIGLLKEHYGAPARPLTSNPFEMILWENVAYLAPPSRRGAAFEYLKDTIGTDPTAIAAADPQALEQVASRGILKRTFAGKLRECARIAIDRFGGDLGQVIREPLAEAKQALQSFPGIGEPGAEKILLFSGQQALLAPDSNGLRVLVRLGLINEERTYARTYAASREISKELPADPAYMQDAHLLLQQHGRTLCKRNNPRCEACPLSASCAYAVSFR